MYPQLANAYNSDKGFHFNLSPSWHQTAFIMVIGSGFPCLFLGYSPFDHILCTVQLPLHVFSHSPVFLSLLCLCFLCSVSHFARSLLNILVYCSQVFSLPFVFPSHQSFLEFNFCFVVFWASNLSISSFFSLQRSNSKLHTVVSQEKSGVVPGVRYFSSL